ncbi:hypothetical protein JS278_01166 [Acidipropionibacterium virtanenii]|uniref:Uncharacterized protein n=1 Tax=Acidipropionibacterium virtanenii TaxID=2057246 RepID=A0A344USU8_9ACTN|nr:hypothetical protein JS278_01166 [Acidipropionibacterium virtanenii]
MSRVTEGHLVRHYRGAKCGRDAALLDIVAVCRGAPPIEPDDILTARTSSDFRTEDIGYLTKPVRIDEWIATVRTRYAFLADLDTDERRWVQCNGGDRYEVETTLTTVE